MNKAEFLDKVKEIVVDRGKSYGTAWENFQNIANAWNGLGGEHAPFTVAAAAYMLAMKLARLQTNPTHLDSVIDIVGEAACWAEMIDEQKGKKA